MNKFISRFVNDESGATAIEYGLIVAFIAIGLATAAKPVGEGIAAVFGKATTALETAG